MWADALPNLLIGLREGLEGGLVVSILLAAVHKHRAAMQTETGQTGAGQTGAGAVQTGAGQTGAGAVWIGTAAAVVLALSFGAVLTFYRSVLPGTGREALGGILSVVAVGLVTPMVFWMRRTARNLAGDLRSRVDAAMRISAAALALTAFLAVAREGTETALFLWTAAQASGQTAAPLTGAAVGIGCAVVLCVLLYRRAVKIRLDKFFGRTAILLIVVAGGVLAYGIGDLQDAGLLPGHLWVAFDLTGHIDPSSWWMSLITGVTELSPKMTWLQVAAYLSYLGVVLPLFVFGRQSTVAPPAPRPSVPGKGAPSYRRTAVMITSAFAVPPVAAASLIALAPGAAGAGTTDVAVTGTACAPGWSAARAGAQSFTVTNRSGRVAEVYLVQAATGGVVAEIETLGPGTSAPLLTTLGAGGYQFRCLVSGRPATTSGVVLVTGAAAGSPPAVKPVAVAGLEPVLRAYNAYVAGRLGVLAGQVQRIQADLLAGDLVAARADWLPAMLTWEQVGEEPYGSFGDYGVKIGAGPQGFPDGTADPGFTGLHRLEYGLWHGQSAAKLLPVTARLASDIGSVRADLPGLSDDPASLPVRAHEILEDALRDHLSGQLDQGSGASYPETLADVQADRVVLGELAGLLARRDPKLLPAAGGQLDTLERALLGSQVDGRWVAVNAVPLAQRQRVDAAIGAVLETLSLVPAQLETPAH